MTNHAIIAFSGLSLAGKSTMTQMLLERSLNAVVVRENTFDPIRPATSQLNKLFKTMSIGEAVEQSAAEFSQHQEIIMAAYEYALSLRLEGPGQQKARQAILAYLFTAGRVHVNEEVKKLVQEHDVILDRYLIDGWAYQCQPPVDCEDEEYSWQMIKNLNEKMGIWYPNMQVIITCPIKQIPQRKAYRQKTGVGTAGQMSSGREEIILKALTEIHLWLLDHGVPTILIENSGTPTENFEDQIRQAIPVYMRMEKELRDWIEGGLVGGFDNYQLSAEPIDDQERYWLEPERLQRIHTRQTSKV